MAPGNGTAEWHEETVRVEEVDLIVIKGGGVNPSLSCMKNWAGPAGSDGIRRWRKNTPC